MKTVFVHGAPNGPDIWNGLISELQLSPENCCVLALPGFSVPCGVDFTPGREAYADWLIQRVDDIASSSGEPVRILGHDFGAIFTLRACSLRPELFSSWVAFNSLIDGEAKPHAMARIFRLPVLGELLAKLVTNKALVAAGLKKQGLPDVVAEREASRIGSDMCRSVLALYRTPVVADQPHPWESDLSHLPEKGLMVWGEDDPYVAVDVARRFATRWAVPLHIESGAGHWPFVQNPAPIARRIQEFWGA